ncbi:hypothetical protein D1007_52536 [Hordeum vulgare]|nr:hypothetical protein D1007_52536 [Hordeum vulgare]
MKYKGKSPAVLVRAPESYLSPRQRVNVLVHQPRWHWENRVPLAYANITLPHDSHLGPERIPVRAVPRSVQTHAKEHEEQRRHGIRDVVAGPPPPLIVREEDQEAEAAYQNALATVLRVSEEEAHLKKEEEAYEKQLAEGIALSAANDIVLPPLAPPSLAAGLAIPRLRLEVYAWDGVVRE